jgi:WD40 repeat protein
VSAGIHDTSKPGSVNPVHAAFTLRTGHFSHTVVLTVGIGDNHHMGDTGHGGDAKEITLMRQGVRDWVLRRRGEHELRRTAPPVLLSLLCAAAFCPVIEAGAALNASGAAVAGIGLLGSLGGSALSDVIMGAMHRLRSRGTGTSVLPGELEEEIARQFGQVLNADGAEARTLRVGMAAVLQEIGAGEVVLRTAIETASENVCDEVASVIGLLGSGFSEMGFLIKDVWQVSAGIQETLDIQGAGIRVLIGQNDRESADIRRIRRYLEVIEQRAPAGLPGNEGSSQRGPAWADGCPYRGLAPFGEADAEVYYGREQLTTELAVKVARQMALGGLVVVTGASGAGKSSLLRAGLLPALAQGTQVQGSQDWPRLVITPAVDPLTELAAHLAALGGTSTVAIREQLARNPDQAHLTVRQAILASAARYHDGQPPSGDQDMRLALIVDQFEEIFTLKPGEAGEPDRQAFITALCSAATHPAGPGGQPPALVVIAVRGDFWDRCAAYPEMARALQEGQFLVGPMTEPELRRAITGPAEAAGLRIDAALVDTILADLRTAASSDTIGALPLLSQAMLLTWENRESDRLTSHGYGLAGGVSRAVQSGADAAYDSLEAHQQALAPALLRSMTVGSRDGQLTCRPVSRTDLYGRNPQADESDVDAVLETFAAQRLIVLDEGTAQISHDVLLRAWPKLRSWLEEDQATWILYSQLTEDAASWHDGHHDASFLYRGAQLSAVRQAAAGWAANRARYPALDGIERDFLHSSERAAARSSRQRRMLAATLVLLLIASLAGAGIAIVAARNANQQRDLAVSGQLTAQSEALDATDPVTASQLAAAAWHLDPTAQAYASLLDAIAQPQRAVLHVSASPVVAVAFSPNGKVLATAAGNVVRLWDVATQRQVGASMKAVGSADYVAAVAFSPDGKALATAAGDMVRLWDVATQRQVGASMRAADGPGGGVNAIAFSADGKVLATAGGYSPVRLWDVADQRDMGALPSGVDDFAEAVAFSPDGKTLVTGSNNEALLWNVATRTQISAPLVAGDAASFVTDLAFSPNGKMLATSNPAGTAFWSMPTGQQIGKTLPSQGGMVQFEAFSRDGKILATTSPDGAVKLWNVATHQQVGAPLTASNSPENAVAFSPHGNVLATGDGDGTARLWDIATRRQIGGSLRVTGGPGCVAFSPDGKILATGSGHTVRLWHVATHRQIGAALKVGNAQNFVDSVAFSPDGKILATGNTEGKIRLEDVATGRQIGARFGSGNSFSDDVEALAFSPDGKVLVSASIDRVRLWDMATRRQIGEFRIGPPFTTQSNSFATVSSVAFSADGKTLATVTGDVARLWNVTTHRQSGSSMSPGTDSNSVSSVAFSPDGKILATATIGGVQLWDMATRQQIGQPVDTGSGGNNLVEKMTFSPDGKILATASASAFRLWDVAVSSNPMRLACSISGRSLTHQEWNTYIKSVPYQAVCP